MNKVTFSNTEADVAGWYRHHFENTRAGRRAVWVNAVFTYVTLFLLYCGLGAVLGLLLPPFGTWFYLVIILGYPSVVLVIMWVRGFHPLRQGVDAMTTQHTKRLLKSPTHNPDREAWFATKTLVLHENGIEFESPNIKCTTSKNVITKVDRAGDYLRISLDRGIRLMPFWSFIIPRSVFESDEAFEEFVAAAEVLAERTQADAAKVKAETAQAVREAKPKKQSRLGIASFVLGLVTATMALLCLLTGALLHRGLWSVKVLEVVYPLTGFLSIGSGFTGFGLSLGGVFARNRKKGYAFLGLLLNAGTFVVACVLVELQLLP